MRLLSEIKTLNETAESLPRLPKGAPWPEVWGQAKAHPYYGIMEITLSDQCRFLALCLNDDTLALYYLWTGGGLTEPLSIALWLKLAAKARVAVDAGAYTGFYALGAAIAGAQKVVAFEPVSFIHARVASNVALNALPRVKAENAALSDIEGVSEIGIRFGSSLFSSGSTLLTEGRTDQPIKQPCRVTTLDKTLRGEPVDLVKIDVEGSEAAVLRGAREVLEQSHPVLLVETRGSTFKEVAGILSTYGYKSKFVEDANGASNHLFWSGKSRLASLID